MTAHVRRHLEDELRWLRRRLTEPDLGVEASGRFTRQAGAFAAALDRMDDGTYGTCEGCGDPINPRRLEVLPEAAFCTACQTERDVEAERARRVRASDDEDEDVDA